MGNWQEVIALGIVALTGFVLAFRTIRQWMATKTIGGCGGCKGCSSAPKVSPSSPRHPSTTSELLKLETPDDQIVGLPRRVR